MSMTMDTPLQKKHPEKNTAMPYNHNFPELVAGNLAGTLKNGKNHFKQTFLILVLLESIHLID